MKVVCDNCGAIYKIPEKKLVKEVNKATCRKCGHRILIRRDVQTNGASSPDSEEATLIAHAAQVSGGSEPVAPAMTYPPFGQSGDEPTPLPTSPLDAHQAAAEPAGHTPTPAPAAAAYAPQPTPAAPVAAPAPRPAAEPAAKPAHDPLGDMTVVFLSQGAVLAGALLLALARESIPASFAGLFLALWGGLTSLFILMSGQWGRRKAWTVSSGFVGLVLASVSAAGISLWAPVMSFIQNPDVAAMVDTLTQRGATATAPTAPVTEPVVPPVVTPPEPPTEQPDEVTSGEEEPPPVADADEEPQGLLDVIAEPPAVEDEPPAPVEPPPSTTSTRTPTSSSTASSSSSRTPTSSSSRTPSSTSSTSSTSSRTPSSTSSTSSRTPSSTSSTSSRTPSSASSTSSTSSRTSSSSSSSSRSDLPSSVPTTVIDIQIRNNKNVKSCFVAYKATTGELPQVTLRFTLESDGHVSSGSIREAAYQGTSLESCLVGSVKMIDFPEFSGPAQTLNYPFRF